MKKEILTLIPTAFKMSYFPWGGGEIWPAFFNHTVDVVDGLPYLQNCA